MHELSNTLLNGRCWRFASILQD